MPNFTHFWISQELVKIRHSKSGNNQSCPHSTSYAALQKHEPVSDKTVVLPTIVIIKSMNKFYVLQDEIVASLNTV